jgi:hypothetical protein
MSYLLSLSQIKIMQRKILGSALAIIFLLGNCKKLEDLNRSPELDPLEQGFKSCATIGYCAALAKRAFTGESLPSNVTFEQRSENGYSSAGVLHVRVTKETPLPFNTSVGNIYIAGLWDDTHGGVISIVFADINILTSEFKFYGLYTVPVNQKVTGEIISVFAEQDIIIGEGNDTLLNLSLSKPKFDAELARLNEPYPTDVFTAVKQNVWFITINQNTQPPYLFDKYTINGGGQILEASSNSGGVLYHAMLNTKFSYDQCELNPLSGIAFIQNMKASGSSVDLGNITLEFHDACDGRASVKVATGKYVTSNGKNIDLHWN